MIYRLSNPFLQEEKGACLTLIYQRGAPVDGALFTENYIRPGQRLTSVSVMS